MFERFKLNKRKAELEIEKDVKKVEDTIKKDAGVLRQDIKKLESDESFNMFFTYGWAIAIIIIGIIGFIWWNYFNVNNESCEFLDGSGFICENFDVTNNALNVNIRNVNNKSIFINKIYLNACFIEPNKTLEDNTRMMANIPCNISSGKFKESLIVNYKIDDFEKHAVAKISKIVP